MDNETPKYQISSKTIERIVIFVSDIIEKIIASENASFLVRSKNLEKEGIINNYYLR